MRVCKKCGVEKNIEEFRKRTDRGDRRYVCLGCDLAAKKANYELRRDERLVAAKQYYVANKDAVAQYSKQYRKTNQERLKLQSRARHAANPELKRSLARQWAKDNRERHNANTLRWAKENPTKQRELCRKWEAANRDKCTAKRQKRRALKAGNGGSYSSEHWVLLKKMCGNRCLKCGRSESVVALTVDHVKPIALGGRNELSNLQPLCKTCNSSKAAKEQDFRDAPIKTACKLLQHFYYNPQDGSSKARNTCTT